MIRGLYTAASGMIMEQTRNDTIANNLANVNTAGYKKDVAVFQTFPEMLISRLGDVDKQPIEVEGAETLQKPPVIGTLGTGVRVDGIYQIHKEGPLRETGAPLDLALGGDGFFVIETPRGERYTRNGTFSLDSDGYLVTSEGRRVLGQGGAIQLQPPGAAGEGKVQVDAAGRVTVDGTLVDTLRVVEFADRRALTKEGDSLFAAGTVQGVAGNAAPTLLTGDRLKVMQGYQEQSNVNSVSEMVEMITAMRSYEASQKAVQSEDHLLDKAVNEVGRV